MNFEIVELNELSGEKAIIYSIIPQGDDKTLYESFIEEHRGEFKAELIDITIRLREIGKKTGAREGFFKKEGDRAFVKQYGDVVCALYDLKKRNLRLYCLRLGNIAVILGGGGYKSKHTIKWQDDERLSEEVNKMMDYARCILEQMKNGEIYWSKDGTQLEGNLKNYDDEQRN